MKKNNTIEKPYIDKVHVWGRLWCLTALCVLLMVPVAICLRLNVWPDKKALLTAMGSLIPIYWTTAVIEVFAYVPLLGVGGTYLSFVTGNVSNLKLPCGMDAIERAGYKPHSDEGEVISTISVAASAITTTVVIAVGVVLFGPVIKSVLGEESTSIIKTGFDNVIPALFGALLASYFKKYWKIAVLPVLMGCIVYIFVPTLAVGTMIFVTIVASFAGALGMYKLKWIE